jgi:zinc/manganese transport system ATP-binding protein
VRLGIGLVAGMSAATPAPAPEAGTKPVLSSQPAPGRSDSQATDPSAIELDQVTLGWRDRVAVRDVTGRFARGSLTAIVGPNGAGKSTLIKGLMGQISPLRGRMALARGLRLACLPQISELDTSFPVTVYDLVALGCWRAAGAWRGLTADDHQHVQLALHEVGLGDFGSRVIGTLSGGQLQRALFARLLLHDADILLLDEPFSAVDRHTTDVLMELLHRWHGQGRTIAVVLHDLDMVHRHFPSTLLLGRQAVAWADTATALTPENLHKARHLCAGDFQ